MNIKILDSWLRDYLITKATPEEIAHKLSLTSVSVERLEKYNNDFTYDIEITTNRPDLVSIIGLARETAAILPTFGIPAKFVNLNFEKINGKNIPIEIISDPKLVNRVLAVAMDVKINNSSKEVKERLETSGIRSLNNVIDVTNYVMRVIGHPTHVFDLDRLDTKKLIIREAKKGEQIQTLDNKIYSLKGGEIIAINDNKEIVDLLGVMGLSNSVVTKDTTRILFFVNNNEKHHIRKTSMELGIRTEAASINEKGIDTQTSMEAMLYGISLFKKYANAKNISQILDIYPNKNEEKTISVSLEKINKVLGIEIDIAKSQTALETLGFKTIIKNNKIEAKIPNYRNDDIEIEEDLIEEIARIYGYHNLPSILPPLNKNLKQKSFINDFYWEKRIKQAMKYWGFTETYTYSFVSEKMYEGPIDQAVEISNPLTKDFVYMRNTLIPSLLQVINNNSQNQEIKIFEISNIYLKQEKDLPSEMQSFAGIIKKERNSFFEVKGLIEQILNDVGIKNIIFKSSKKGGIGSSVFIDKDYLGEIEVLDSNLINFELDFKTILKHATNKKAFNPFAKYPPIFEDLTAVIESNYQTEEIINNIKSQSNIITDVSLKDTYNDSKTFHIVYQDFEKNLTKDDVSEIREKIITSLKEIFNASIK